MFATVMDCEALVEPTAWAGNVSTVSDSTADGVPDVDGVVEVELLQAEPTIEQRIKNATDERNKCTVSPNYPKAGCLPRTGAGAWPLVYILRSGTVQGTSCSVFIRRAASAWADCRCSV